MDKQLEPWEGYRGPPLPEGTDASQIPILRRASKWRVYDPSLHYVSCSRGSESRIWSGDTGGLNPEGGLNQECSHTPGASEHRGDLQEPGDLSRRGDAWERGKK